MMDSDVTDEDDERDEISQIEAQLVMRNYEGFLGGGGRLRGRRN